MNFDFEKNLSEQKYKTEYYQLLIFLQVYNFYILRATYCQ